MRVCACLLLFSFVLAGQGRSAAAGGDVTWLSPVLQEDCKKTCEAGNDPAFPDLWLTALVSDGRQLCRILSTGRIGNVFAAGKASERKANRGCYVANRNEAAPSPNDKCPKKGALYECGCMSKTPGQQPEWVPYDQMAARCNDPASTWAVCRVRRTSTGPTRRQYGIGTFLSGGQGDRCLFNPTAARPAPQACNIKTATADSGFEVLCLDPQ